MNLISYLVFLIFVTVVNGFFIPQNRKELEKFKRSRPTRPPQHEYGNLLRELAIFKRKLQNQGLYPKVYSNGDTLFTNQLDRDNYPKEDHFKLDISGEEQFLVEKTVDGEPVDTRGKSYINSNKNSGKVAIKNVSKESEESSNESFSDEHDSSEEILNVVHRTTKTPPIHPYVKPVISPYGEGLIDERFGESTRNDDVIIETTTKGYREIETTIGTVIEYTVGAKFEDDLRGDLEKISTTTQLPTTIQQNNQDEKRFFFEMSDLFEDESKEELVEISDEIIDINELETENSIINEIFKPQEELIDIRNQGVFAKKENEDQILPNSQKTTTEKWMTTTEINQFKEHFYQLKGDITTQNQDTVKYDDDQKKLLNEEEENSQKLFDNNVNEHTASRNEEDHQRSDQNKVVNNNAPNSENSLSKITDDSIRSEDEVDIITSADNNIKSEIEDDQTKSEIIANGNQIDTPIENDQIEDDEANKDSLKSIDNFEKPIEDDVDKVKDDEIRSDTITTDPKVNTIVETSESEDNQKLLNNEIEMTIENKQTVDSKFDDSFKSSENNVEIVIEQNVKNTEDDQRRSEIIAVDSEYISNHQDIEDETVKSTNDDGETKSETFNNEPKYISIDKTIKDENNVKSLDIQIFMTIDDDQTKEGGVNENSLKSLDINVGTNIEDNVNHIEHDRTRSDLLINISIDHNVEDENKRIENNQSEHIGKIVENEQLKALNNIDSTNEDNVKSLDNQIDGKIENDQTDGETDETIENDDNLKSLDNQVEVTIEDDQADDVTEVDSLKSLVNNVEVSMDENVEIVEDDQTRSDTITAESESISIGEILENEDHLKSLDNQVDVTNENDQTDGEAEVDSLKSFDNNVEVSMVDNVEIVEDDQTRSDTITAESESISIGEIHENEDHLKSLDNQVDVTIENDQTDGEAEVDSLKSFDNNVEVSIAENVEIFEDDQTRSDTITADSESILIGEILENEDHLKSLDNQVDVTIENDQTDGEAEVDSLKSYDNHDEVSIAENVEIDEDDQTRSDTITAESKSISIGETVENEDHLKSLDKQVDVTIEDDQTDGEVEIDSLKSLINDVEVSMDENVEILEDDQTRSDIITTEPELKISVDEQKNHLKSLEDIEHFKSLEMEKSIPEVETQQIDQEIKEELRSETIDNFEDQDSEIIIQDDTASFKSEMIAPEEHQIEAEEEVIVSDVEDERRSEITAINTDRDFLEKQEISESHDLNEFRSDIDDNIENPEEVEQVDVIIAETTGEDGEVVTEIYIVDDDVDDDEIRDLGAFDISNATITIEDVEEKDLEDDLRLDAEFDESQNPTADSQIKTEEHVQDKITLDDIEKTMTEHAESRSFNHQPNSNFLYKSINDVHNRFTQHENQPRRSDILVYDDDYIEPTIEYIQSNFEDIPRFDEESTDMNPNFDELEILKLIPVIIEQMKQGVVTPIEKDTLSQIFGDLWPVIVDESNRKPGEEVSPVLKALLQSRAMRLSKREINSEFQNDIQGNSVNLVPTPEIEDGPLRIQLSLNEHLPPSQRLMRAAALLIQRSYMEDGAGLVNHRYNHRLNKNRRRKLKNRRRKLNNRRRHLDLKQRIRRSIDWFGMEDIYDDSSDEEMMQNDFYNNRVEKYDNDDPSIFELLEVAERHRLRRQQENKNNAEPEIRVIPYELFGLIKDDYVDDQGDSDEEINNDDYVGDYYDDWISY